MSVKIKKLDNTDMAFMTKVNDGDKQAMTLAAPMPGVIASEVLFAGARELLINHASVSYRLRITHQGKLILTK